MKKMYDKKGNCIAVSLSVKEQEMLAGVNNASIREQKQKLKELDQWLEEQDRNTTEQSSSAS